MNRHVNAITGRLSLRPPQSDSLEILHDIFVLAEISKSSDTKEVLEAIKEKYPSVTDFERKFPSICFALATGVGKTRLMGAFISYLHLEHRIRNFFVLAPNLTIYNKLIGDFSPEHPKYVFKGIAEFAVEAPAVITGDTYESIAGPLLEQIHRCKINIFNISKINSEVRGGKSPKIRKLSEYLGQSYFEYLAGLDDLVLLMDESHRYRASAGVRALNELKPILGLELTATPFVEATRGAKPFNNIIYDYALGKAMEDGFVKETAVVTRKNFSPDGMSKEDVEEMKLMDGVRLHEKVKVELETYARETGNEIVKPFVLVIARDTSHASQLLDLIQSSKFFEGRYSDKVIQVDSSTKGKKEDEMIERLLKVESRDEPTEIVIHVNMLKEGWDVTNLYTIIPLRAANARVLIEQSIGRGLRLPYGKRTGVDFVDTLNIISHDKFQEVVDAAKDPESPLHMKQLVLSDEDLDEATVTVVAEPQLTSQLGLQAPTRPGSSIAAPATAESLFETELEQQAAQAAYRVIRRLENSPERVPSATFLQKDEIQNQVREEVERMMRPLQASLPGLEEELDIRRIVAQTAQMVVDQTIDIPRILVVPSGEVTNGYHPFDLDLSAVPIEVPTETLWRQHLRTQKQEELVVGGGGIKEKRLEDYVVSGLIGFDDVSYVDHSDFLYELAGKVVEHVKSKLSDEANVHKVLRYEQKAIARLVYSQMQAHYWEKASGGFHTKVSRGYTALKPSAYTARKSDGILDFRTPPKKKSEIVRYVFDGFERCLYPALKFQSNSERMLSVILDRDSIKWFKPVRGQFQLFYSMGGNQREYQPDFVAETDDTIYMFEPKSTAKVSEAEVEAKRDAAVEWCKRATDHAKTYGGKPWKYILVPHDAITDNMTLEGLASKYEEN